MSQDVIGGAIALPTTEITSLSDLPAGTNLTESQLRAAIAKLDVVLLNITTGNGTYGAAEYEERGDVGFRIRTADSLKQMIELRKHYVEMLKDPTMLNDFEVLMSKFDDPNL